MAVPEIKEDVDALLRALIKGIDLLSQCMQHDDCTAVAQAEEVILEVRCKTETATAALIEQARADPMAAKFVGVPAHLMRIQTNMARMAHALKVKASEMVLFSDLASGEMLYLLERLRDLFVHLRELLVEHKFLVSRHIISTAKTIEESAQKFASKHEERLIEGLCAPISSTVFLEVIEGAQNISWHAKEMAKELAS